MTTKHAKPLFIPLMRRYFEAFKNGTKRTEYRRYGRQWTEKHCTPGRPAILSLGYGKYERISATIVGFRVLDDEPGETRIYPVGTKIAAIDLKLSRPARRKRRPRSCLVR